MSLVLSDASYVALARIFPGNVRRPMVLISMMAGLAGSIGWASTYLLLRHGSWHLPLLLYASLLAFVAAPLLLFALPRPPIETRSWPSMVTAACQPRPTSPITFCAGISTSSK